MCRAMLKVTGFDNSAESRIIEPHLTTVDIPSSKMGYIAADMLLSPHQRTGYTLPDHTCADNTEVPASTGELNL